eukprot:Clim_evm89s142 gene=Clim_evmTU89s142
MKIILHATCAALLASIILVDGAPAAISRRQATQDPLYCPSPREVADPSIWEPWYSVPDNKFMWAMSGQMDMREMSKYVKDTASDFEDFMSRKLGNFAVVDGQTGYVDEFKSLLWKLNAVVGPLLMGPYNIERTNSNAVEWDEWWDALKDLTAADGMEAYCNPDANDKDYKPWAVSFPWVFNDYSHPINYQYRHQEGDTNPPYKGPARTKMSSGDIPTLLSNSTMAIDLAVRTDKYHPLS